MKRKRKKKLTDEQWSEKWTQEDLARKYRAQQQVNQACKVFAKLSDQEFADFMSDTKYLLDKHKIHP